MKNYDAFQSNNERFLNESETSSQKPSGNFGKKQKLNEKIKESEYVMISFDWSSTLEPKDFAGLKKFGIYVSSPPSTSDEATFIFSKRKFSAKELKELDDELNNWKDE